MRPARNPAGTNCSFGTRPSKETKDSYPGEVRLVGVPGWTGDNRVWIRKCSTPDERARAIDAVLFFSGEETHYYSYPKGHFEIGELKIAKETETTKSFFGRMTRKYSKKNGVLTIRTPISPPTSGPASAFYTAEESATAEESEDNANARRNPTIAESSQSLQAPQPPIASAQKTADKCTDEYDYGVMQLLLCSEDQAPSRDGGESHRLAGFSTVLNYTATPGAQNHSPGVTPSFDKFFVDETFEIPPWV